MSLLTPKHLSAKGAAFIGAYEGLRLYPYNDAVGNATVGYGHLIHYGPVTHSDIVRYAGFTVKDAVKLLQADAEHVAYAVREIAPAIKDQTRFDALVSIGFNCGTGVLAANSSLGYACRLPGRKGAADAFLLYDHAGGEVLPGLARRRRNERNLWTTGSYAIH